MKRNAQEFMAGIFAFLLGAGVLLGHYFMEHEPHTPGKWEIGGGVFLAFLGLWLMSPDAVTYRINQARDALPFLEDTHTHDRENENG